MNTLIRALVVGAAAAAAAEYAPSFLPDAIDVGGFPVRKYGGAGAAAWLAMKFTKGASPLAAK